MECLVRGAWGSCGVLSGDARPCAGGVAAIALRSDWWSVHGTSGGFITKPSFCCGLWPRGVVSEEDSSRYLQVSKRRPLIVALRPKAIPHSRIEPFGRHRNESSKARMLVALLRPPVELVVFCILTPTKSPQLRRRNRKVILDGHSTSASA